MIFDLDPPGDAFAEIQDAARRVRALLDELGLAAFVQTTGSRGLHVVVPLDRNTGFDDVRVFARAAATHLAARHPDSLTVEQRKQARAGRVFIDTLRNAYGQTAVAPYAVRPLEDAPIATPLTWSEALAADMSPRRYTIRNMFRRLGQVDDPWRDIDRAARPLAPARKRLDARSAG